MLIGRKLRSTQLGETLLPKRIALPVFASDALSSVAYAPDEIFLTLAVAGVAAVGVLLEDRHAVVVRDARRGRVVPAERARLPVRRWRLRGRHVNVGPTAGLTVASALMVDYVLTVAVSISSGVQYAKSALPFLAGQALLAVEPGADPDGDEPARRARVRRARSRSRRTSSWRRSSGWRSGDWSGSAPETCRWPRARSTPSGRSRARDVRRAARRAS